MTTPPSLNYDQTLIAAFNAIEFYRTIWANDPVKDAIHVWQKSNQVDSYLNLAEQCTRAFGAKNTYDWYSLVRDINMIETPDSLLADLWNNVDQAIRKQDLWTDDYGWAGIACLQVANWVMDKEGANPVWQLWYAKAVECWQRMQLVANTLSLGGQPVPNGILNRPLAPNSEDEHKHFVKNTVSNALYFVLSLRLYLFIRNTNNIPVNPHLGDIKKQTLQAAFAMYTWFRGWINQPAMGPTLPRTFWHSVGGEPRVAMLEERPVAYPPLKGVSNPLPPDNTYDGYNPYDLEGQETAPPYSPESAWTGDQGLFLHGCCLLYMWREDIHTVLGQDPAVVAQIESDLLNWIPAIANGVLAALTQGYTDNVLRESPFDCFFFGDPDDYVCGRGVLARYFMRPETLQCLQMIEYDIVSLFTPAWQATSYYCAVTNPNFNPNIPVNSSPGQLSAVWHAGPNTFNPVYDKAANIKFCALWGLNPTDHQFFTWPPIRTDTAEVWRNYCMMMGFDVYGAWIQANPFWSPPADKPGEEEKAGGGKEEHGREACHVHRSLSAFLIPKEIGKK
jgi:hypothetical protein